MALFALASGGLMYFFHFEPNTLSGQVLWLQRILFQRTLIKM
jgi:hypothetical protein